MLNKTNLILLLFITSVFVQAQEIPKLTILTEDWKPFQYIEYGELKGISVDVMSLMLDDLGTNKYRHNIQLLPWTRAYTDATKNNNTVLFLTARTKSREKMFKWVGPLLRYKTFLITRKDNPIKIEGLESIKKYRYAAVKDDASVLFLEDLGVPSENIVQANVGTDMLKVLYKGRVDIVLSEWSSLLDDLNKLNLTIDDFKVIYTVNQSELYYAFNYQVSDNVVNKFQESFNKLDKSGKIDEVFKQYGEEREPN